jgi:hypothetical protein
MIDAETHRLWRSFVAGRVRDAYRRSTRLLRAQRPRPPPSSPPAPLLTTGQALAMLHNQSYRCALCSSPLTPEPHHPNTASLDRLACPGPAPCTYGPDSVRWTCWACNHALRHCFMPSAKYGSRRSCLRHYGPNCPLLKAHPL